MPDLRAPADRSLRIDAETLSRLVAEIFERLGLSGEDASVAADVLVTADLMGVDSHGVSNYVELLYEPGLRGGTIVARPEITTVHETPVSALLDGGGGLGLVVGVGAMRLALEKAAATGVGMVAVRNSRHYGMAGYYSRMALAQDMIGLSLTNSDKLVVPTFGRESRIGTNPIAVAVPAASEPPFLLDMATSTVPFGKIMLARRNRVDLPEGWAADREGRPTRDAAEAFEAQRLLPLGGSRDQGSHKGYGLGVVVDVLSGILSGAGTAAGQGLGGQVGHFFAAARIDAFRPASEFKAMMDDYLAWLRSTPPAPGEERVYYAGLIEHEVEQDRLAHGIPLHRDVLDYLRGLARSLEIEPPF